MFFIHSNYLHTQLNISRSQKIYEPPYQLHHMSGMIAYPQCIAALYCCYFKKYLLSSVLSISPLIQRCCRHRNLAYMPACRFCNRYLPVIKLFPGDSFVRSIFFFSFFFFFLVVRWVDSSDCCKLLHCGRAVIRGRGGAIPK